MKVLNPISFRVFKIVQKNQFVKDILQSIDASSGKALLVGGAVRDIFLDVPTKDLDFEVYGLTLQKLQEILEQYGTVSFIGKSFGVLRLHGLDVDWSLPRQDSSGRHPMVQYDPSMSYEQAFIRRDVTVNAMGIDMQTCQLIDPFGGLQDLQNKILRSPDLDFFGQDPLRLLRVMQFAARFEMAVDQSLSQLCSSMDMSKVSVERIEQEFAKLFLQARHPSIGLQWLVEIKKFHEFLPGVIISETLWKVLDDAAVQEYASDQEKLVVMWAIVASFLDVPSTHQFQQLTRKDQHSIIMFMQRLSRHDHLIGQVASLVGYAALKIEDLSDAQIKWLALWLAPELSIRLLSKFIGLRYRQLTSDFLINRAEKLGVLDVSEQPLLTGKDFLDVAQGVQVGLLVKKAYQLQIDQGITDRDVLKNMSMLID
jgi:tRNA nucleotidyltransferase/poly(A) polymerase